MKSKTVKIERLIDVPELKTYYNSQSIDQLVQSIKDDGGLNVPIIVSLRLEIIDGYKRVEAMKELGYKTIDVLMDEVKPIIFERMVSNMFRTITFTDEIQLMRA